MNGMFKHKCFIIAYFKSRKYFRTGIHYLFFPFPIDKSENGKKNPQCVILLFINKIKIF